MSDRGTGDNWRSGSDSRLAVLEDVVKRLDARLEQVSARTHTLSSTIQAVSLLSEEAREQRAEMIEKLDNIERATGVLDRAVLTATLGFTTHVQHCTLRSSRLEKIALAALAALFALLVAVVAPHLSH